MPVADADFLMLFILFIISIGGAAVGMVFTILLAITTPAFTFLKAKFRKKSLLVMRRRDRKIEFVIADSHIEGLATNSKYKVGYMIDMDSVYSEKKSGISLLPVTSELGITLNEKNLRIIDGLKRMGYNNIDEAYNANLLYGLCPGCQYEGFMDFEKDKEGKPTLDKEGQLMLKCPFEGQEVEYDEERQEEAAGAGEPTDEEVHAPKEHEDNQERHADPGAGDDVQLR